MHSSSEKLSYLVTQARRRLSRRQSVCPNCEDTRYVKLDSKALVSELRECQHCRLMYRFPTDSEADSAAFYQRAYSQGFTTSLPDDAELAALMAVGFDGHEKSYRHIIELLEGLGVRKGARVLDFGCSWGFGSWQLAAHGYRVKGYEISQDRARFARERLAIDVVDRLDDLRAPAGEADRLDVFFSNHVIEHVPSPSDTIELARGLVREGGLFIAITPNGSLGFREAAPQSWHRFWGKVHPNLISDTFWLEAFRAEPHFIGSLPSDFAAAAAWAQRGGQVRGCQTDAELICIARL